MTVDGQLFITWFFREFLRFFTCFWIPGTTVTPLAMFLFIIFVSVVIKFTLSVINGATPVSSGKINSSIKKFKE